jgi:hypothetical protein
VFFPEFLYQLNARDQQITWLDPLALQIATSVGGATVVGNIVPSLDRVMILQAMCGDSNPGAAQTLDTTFLQLIPPGGTPAFSIAGFDFSTLPSGNDQFVNWVGSMMVPPGWTLRMTSIFNAAVAANVISFNVFGILIPVGNIQRL